MCYDSQIPILRGVLPRPPPRDPGPGPAPPGTWRNIGLSGPNTNIAGDSFPGSRLPREAPQYWFTRSDPRGGKGFHNPGQAPEGAGLRPSLGAWGIYQYCGNVPEDPGELPGGRPLRGSRRPPPAGRSPANTNIAGQGPGDKPILRDGRGPPTPRGKTNNARGTRAILVLYSVRDYGSWPRLRRAKRKIRN